MAIVQRSVNWTTLVNRPRATTEHGRLALIWRAIESKAIFVFAFDD
jgi:hypothetical protein